MDGRPYGKLLPRYAGPIAFFLLSHPTATRADLIDFVGRTFGIRVSRVALYKFLKKFGLDEATRQAAATPAPRPADPATPAPPAILLPPPAAFAPQGQPAATGGEPLGGGPAYGGGPASGGGPAYGGGPASGWAWQPSPVNDVKPGVVPLRPLGLGEILDGAVSIVRASASRML